MIVYAAHNIHSTQYTQRTIYTVYNTKHWLCTCLYFPFVLVNLICPLFMNASIFPFYALCNEKNLNNYISVELAKINLVINN